MARTIQVPAGIGDSVWIMMKLINTGEKFHWELPNGHPQRGKQIFDLLPDLVESCTYVPGLFYKRLERGNIQKYRPYWKKVRDKKFMLSANEHLEKGRRIENFFPDLATTFYLPWKTSDQDKQTAGVLLPQGGTYIGIYGSSYSTTRAWGFWDENKWLEFIKLMHTQDPEFTFVVIGADWDLDLARKLIGLLESEGIKYINTIGQPLGAVLEIMKRLELFCGFPSGLSILNETIPGKATLMFYPPHLELMMNAWADPKRIEDGKYIPLLFCEPEEAYQSIRHIVEKEEAITIADGHSHKDMIKLPSGELVEVPEVKELLTDEEAEIVKAAIKAEKPKSRRPAKKKEDKK